VLPHSIVGSGGGGGGGGGGGDDDDDEMSVNVWFWSTSITMAWHATAMMPPYTTTTMH